jgi:hypothetical protein
MSAIHDSALDSIPEFSRLQVAFVDAFNRFCVAVS